MVAQFLGLKLRLLGNAYVRRSWPLFGVIMLTLGLLLITALVAERLSSLRRVSPEQLGWIVTVGGSFVIVLFVLVPLLAGRRDPFDPRRFALFGIAPTRLALLLLVAGVAAVPLVILGVLILAALLVWSGDGVLLALGVISAILAYLTCLLVSRISIAIAAYFFSDARSRDVGGVLMVLILVIVAGFTVVLLGLDWRSEGPAVLTSLADGLSWTPIGAAWAIPAAGVAGDGAGITIRLLIATGTVVLLWFAWRALVARMLRSERRERVAQDRDVLGWFNRFPATPAGVIAARSMTYWGRDPRYFVALIPVPILPFIMFLPLAIVGVPLEYLALIPLPVTCLFLGWAIHNDVAYDNTAIWQHIVSGRLGAADRIGRMTPSLVFGVPLIAVGSVISGYLSGDWATVPALIGVSVCLLFSGLGLGALTSARFPYPAVRPGDAPFEQPQSAGATPALVQTATFLGVLLLSATPVAFGIMGLAGDRDAFWAALWSGIAMGAVLMIGGVWLGGKIFDRRGSEILTAAERN